MEPAVGAAHKPSRIASNNIAGQPSAGVGTNSREVSVTVALAVLFAEVGSTVGDVTLALEQFTYAFANAIPPGEAKALYERYAVPAPGKPLFQAALANVNWRTEASVNTGQTGPRQ